MFRFVYCLLILSIILPFGPAHSGWTSLAIGQGTISKIGFLSILVLGVYRITTVLGSPRTLSSPEVKGMPAFLKILGQILIYVGIIVTIIALLAPLLLKPSPNAGGIEYFVLGVIFFMISSIGLIGLICYELGRIRSFEIDSNSRA